MAGGFPEQVLVVHKPELEVEGDILDIVGVELFYGETDRLGRPLQVDCLARGNLFGSGRLRSILGSSSLF